MKFKIEKEIKMKEERQFFENKFKDFESAPSLKVWNELEKKLDRKAANRNGIIFMRIAAGLALLIIAFLAVRNPFLMDQNEISDSKTIETTISEQRFLSDETGPNKTEKKENGEEEIENSPKTKTDKTIQKRGTKMYPSKNQRILAQSDEMNSAEVKKQESPIEEIEEKSMLAENAETDNLKIEENVEKYEQITSNENDLKTVATSKSRSITIILPTKEDRELLASNEKKNVRTIDKIRNTINQDFYKHEINLGELPDLALNRIKLGSN